ncbi:MAG: dipeptidase, partial [Pauljensenia sp.]
MADTSHALSSSVLKERLEEVFPSLLEELTQLVAIPSVSSDPAHAADVERSAAHLRERLEALGMHARVLS